TRSYGDWSSDVCSSDLSSVVGRISWTGVRSFCAISKVRRQKAEGRSAPPAARFRSPLLLSAFCLLPSFDLRIRIPDRRQIRRARSDERRVGIESRAWGG